MDAKACRKDEFRDPRTGRCKWRWSADGEVYNVRERFQEDTGEKGTHIPKKWYEYEVWLMDLKKHGKIIDAWDSHSETYLPGQELSKVTAERSLKEIMDDINKKHKDPKYWFSPSRVEKYRG